ncbi:MAG: hypothetical protein Q8930_12810 [Bacillota bacterium]|nr:hypothetical protein [Bacillota bacterium]
MINYCDMNNMYNYNTNNSQSGMNTSNCGYGNIPSYGYCPYRAAYINGTENQWTTYPYNTGYYQYSPMANCIVPNYGTDNGYNNTQRTVYNSEPRMRTVSIEDVVD